jgi:protein-disulfide isomerase
MTPHQQGRLQPPVSDDDHSVGPRDAPVTLVEYGDFECSYCFKAHAIVVKLQTRLSDELRFVFRNFPIVELHPHALEAAQAAESVAARAGGESYWRMHHLIYEHQQDSDDALDRAHLLRYAAAAAADPLDVAMDLEAGTFEGRVQEDFMHGVRSGVNGTPTFFINGVRFDGNWTNPIEFAEALEAASEG